MSLPHLAISAFTCLLLHQPLTACFDSIATENQAVAGIQQPVVPERAGTALDVQLTAASALAWDVGSGTILYEKNPNERRPVASLSKLLSALTVREYLPLEAIVEIPSEARRAQLLGAHIKLPIGHHAAVSDLLSASLVASANDAVTTLAYSVSDSEDEFAQLATHYGETLGLTNTVLANATGLTGGEQYSTAHDIRTLLTAAYGDSFLRPLLSRERGVVVTAEGASRSYTTTNDLLDTYLPVKAAKTGYTLEAGENLAVLTSTDSGHDVGIIILASEQRFQDAKILAEWIQRNYTWE